MVNIKEDLIDFLNQYNQGFYEKNLERVKDFYDTNSKILIYYDNHKGNDTYTVDEHIELIADFFDKGKKTESGGSGAADY